MAQIININDLKWQVLVNDEVKCMVCKLEPATKRVTIADINDHWTSINILCCSYCMGSMSPDDMINGL
jgi:hypothetical protein